MNGVASLRRYARELPPATERCELCGAIINARHHHLLDPHRRELKCACAECSIFFPRHRDSRFLRAPPRAEPLPRFFLSDAQWNDLCLSAGLALFVRQASGIVVIHPCATGVTESLMPADAWDKIARANDLRLAPEVEALLVYRLRGARDYYLVSIDHAYRLADILRQSWRGLSGGMEAAQRIRHCLDAIRGSAGRPVW
jgi:hypothetical protein